MRLALASGFALLLSLGALAQATRESFTAAARGVRKRAATLTK